MKRYPLYYKEQQVGTVTVSTAGCFMRICCRFSPVEEKRVRLCAISGTEKLDLGLCVPYGTAFGVECSVSMHTLGTDGLSFYLCGDLDEEDFYPVSSHQPFEQLQRLQEGRFTYRNGEPGILFQS